MRAPAQRLPAQEAAREAVTHAAGLSPLQHAADRSPVVGRLSLLQRLAAARPIIQRRGENPHAAPGETGGWSRTDHHIISHAKLGEGLGSLEPADRLDVLIAAIPDVLTPEMMANVKVELHHTGEEQRRELQVIRDLLVNPDFDGEIRSIRAEDIRMSFFEWMGGNQFAGPNTSIRTEPSSNKDAIDTDGRFFFGEEHGDKLIGKGKDLYDELDKGDGRDKGAIKQILIEITGIAKNVAAVKFDPSDWVEITDLDVLDRLAGVLGRAHMRNYAYHKVPKPPGKGVFAHPFEMLECTNAGGSEFTYGGKPVKGEVGGPLAFFPVVGAEGVAVPNQQTLTLAQVLDELEPGKRGADLMEETELGIVLKLPPAAWMTIRKSNAPYLKLKDRAYNGAHFPLVAESPPTVARDALAQEVKKSLPAVSLGTYLRENGGEITSWLPKQLHDAAMEQLAEL